MKTVEYYIIAASYLVFALMVLFITSTLSLLLLCLLGAAVLIIVGTAIYVRQCYTIGDYQE